MVDVIYGPGGQAQQVMNNGMGNGQVVYQVPQPPVNYGTGMGGYVPPVMPPSAPVINYGVGVQQQPQQVANWENMVCEIFNYEVANAYVTRDLRIKAISEITSKYGFNVIGCGQNRIVVDLGKVLNGVQNYVLKIASCNLGVIDNMGEYLLSMMSNDGQIMAVTEFNLGPLAKYFKPTQNPDTHGRFIIQKRIDGLSEIAYATKMQPGSNQVGKSVSQIAKEILDSRESERQAIVRKLSATCFIFDLGPDKPFNYGIDPSDNRLKTLDYGYVVPFIYFDLCCGAQPGTYTFKKNVNVGGMLVEKQGLKCSNSTCSGQGAGMLNYVEKDGTDSYVCDCCGHQVSAADLKARLIKSW